MAIDDSLKELINELKQKKENLIQKQNQLLDEENDLRTKISTVNKILNDNRKKEQQPVADDILIRNQKNKNDSLKLEFNKLKAEEEKLKRNTSDLRKKVTNINSILANSAQDFNTKKNILESLRNEIPLIKNKIEDLTFKLNNIENSQNKLENLEKEYIRYNALKNIVVVKFEATEELLNNLKESDTRNYNRAKSIYDRVSSYVETLKNMK